jgi:hypothetical protein
MNQMLLRATTRAARCITCILCFVLVSFLAGCARKTSVQLGSKGMTPGWKINILQVSEPAQAMVLQNDPMVGAATGLPRGPSEDGKKWLVVKVQITPPEKPKSTPTPSPSSGGVRGGVQIIGAPDESEPYGPAAVLTLKKIQLVSPEGSSYSAEALATGGKWNDNQGGQLDEFAVPSMGFTLKDASGRMQIAYETGTLAFYNPGTQELTVLFAVPKSASTLDLLF